MTDHYTTLGVEKTASADEIKRAYRKLASTHHPDKGGDKEKFQEIQQAYAILSDTAKRAEYDNPPPPGFRGYDGAGMDDIFGGIFRQYNGNRPPPRPQYQTLVQVSIHEAYTGTERTMTVNTQTGGKHTIKINVPRGITSGARIRYDNVIPDAMLLVEFHVAPHPDFEINGADLISKHQLSVFDMITGKKFEFTTLSGKTLEVNIKPMTQIGTMLRIPNQGMPVGSGYGTQYIVLAATIPQNIDQSIIDAITNSNNSTSKEKSLD